MLVRDRMSSSCKEFSTGSGQNSVTVSITVTSITATATDIPIASIIKFLAGPDLKFRLFNSRLLPWNLTLTRLSFGLLDLFADTQRWRGGWDEVQLKICSPGIRFLISIHFLPCQCIGLKVLWPPFPNDSFRLRVPGSCFCVPAHLGLFPDLECALLPGWLFCFLLPSCWWLIFYES